MDRVKRRIGTRVLYAYEAHASMKLSQVPGIKAGLCIGKMAPRLMASHSLQIRSYIKSKN
jgi:hypothetical protein